MADNTNDKQGKSAPASSGFFKGVSTEFKKVSWPNRTTLSKQTVAVVCVSVVVGVIIAVLDMAIQYGVNFISM